MEVLGSHANLATGCQVSAFPSGSGSHASSHLQRVLSRLGGSIIPRPLLPWPSSTERCYVCLPEASWRCHHHGRSTTGGDTAPDSGLLSKR